MCHVSHTQTHTELLWRTFKISTNIQSELNTHKNYRRNANVTDKEMKKKSKKKPNLLCFKLAETNS